MSMTITSAEREGFTPMLTHSDRYLNLAMMNIGEAITAIANIRQRGGVVGSEFSPATLALSRAISALCGEKFSAPIDKPEIKDEPPALTKIIQDTPQGNLDLPEADIEGAIAADARKNPPDRSSGSSEIEHEWSAISSGDIVPAPSPGP